MSGRPASRSDQIASPHRAPARPGLFSADVIGLFFFLLAFALSGAVALVLVH